MRFDALQLKKFGKFSDQEIVFPKRERDFHVIVGPNEAGKSTLRAAILDVLFGIPKNTGHGFLHGMPDMRIGAHVSTGNEQLQFERAKALKNTLRTSQDVVLPDQVLLPFLGSADRDFYTQMFSLDHTRLVSGGQSMLTTSSDIGQLLFQSAAGLASLGSARDALEAEAEGLWGKRRAAKHSYYQADDALSAASAALKNSSMRAREYAAAREALAEVERQLVHVRQEHVALRSERGVLERVRRIAPQLERLDRLQSQLQGFSGAVLLAENAAQVVQNVQEALAVQALEQHHHQAQVEQATSALAALHDDEQILARREQLEALHEQRLTLAGHADAIAAKRRELTLLEAQEHRLRKELDWEGALPSIAQLRELKNLLLEQSSLQQSLASEGQALELRQVELRGAQRRLQEMAVADEPLALRLAVEKAQRLGDVADRRARLRGDVERCERTLHTALVALGPWPMTVQQLRSVGLPSRQEIARFAQEVQDRAISVRELRRRQKEIESGIAALRLQLSLTNSNSMVVTSAMLDEARKERDTVWSALRLSPELMPTQAKNLELLLKQADLLADQRIGQLGQAAQSYSEHSRLRTLEEDLRRLTQEIELEEALQCKSDQAWLAQVAACLLPGLPASAAANWLDVRDRVLEEQNQLEAARQTRDEFEAQLKEVEAALHHVLPSASAKASFALALEQGRESLELLGQYRGERRALEAQSLKDQRAVEELQLRLAASQRAHAQWEKNWRGALQRVGRPANISAPDVLKFLESMEQLAALVQERERLINRELRELEAQMHSFAVSVRGFADELQLDVAEATEPELVHQLMHRLRVGLVAQQERDRLRSVQQTSQASLFALAVSAERARASLSPLYASAGVQDIAALVVLIAQSDQQRILRNKIELAEVQIEQAADGFTIEQLREQCCQWQGLDLSMRAEQLLAQEQPILLTMEQLVAQREKATSAVEEFSGSASAATAEAQRQEALSAMAQSAERYIAVHTAARLLRWSVDRFRQVQQGPMLAAASKVFARLSNNSFSSLVVDFDVEPPELLGRRTSGERLKITQMSEGTRDQLYLALRIAALELHCRQAQALPFVADDLFINFDDGRSAAGLDALGELSRHTQVIFLTHHSHLVPLIEEVFADGVNVVRL